LSHPPPSAGTTNDSERGYLALCVAMEREHGTLKQAFTRLCVAWFLFAANSDFRHDLQNEATHKLVVTLKTMLEESYLPFV